MQDTVNQVNNEFSDHLEAINENTNEIQANYEYLCELDSKIDKINERMDEVVMLLKRGNANVDDCKLTFDIQPLNNKEKEVFFALYCLESELGTVTYLDIARKLSLPVSLVMAYITNLFGKGIPIQKRYRNSKVYLTLDPDFRDFQARENVVGINETISSKLIS